MLRYIGSAADVQVFCSNEKIDDDAGRDIRDRLRGSWRVQPKKDAWRFHRSLASPSQANIIWMRIIGRMMSLVYITMKVVAFHISCATQIQHGY